MAEHDQLSRRSFLKGAALSAAGMGLAGASLAGCSSPTTTSGTTSQEAASTGGANTTAIVNQLNPQDYNYTNNTTELPTLFSDWKLGNIQLHHRIVKSAAGSDTFSNGLSEMTAYYLNFAKGGVEMLWVEDFLNIMPNFPKARNVNYADLDLKSMTDAIHAEGSHVGYQLSSMGTSFTNFDSSIHSPFVQALAADLSTDDITNYISGMAVAAQRLQALGFDGIEINAAGDNIGQAFFSRMRNKRTDSYGPQSIENRARFVSDITKGIKTACGNDFIVQVLLNGVEENDENIGQSSLMTTVEENCQICKELEKAGVDSIHVRLGPLNMHICQFASELYFTGYGIDGTTAYGNQFDFSRHWEGKLVANHSGCGLMLDVAAEIKKSVSIPVGAVTYMDPAHAPDYIEKALEDGKVDFILMNRPLTVDTEYVNKLRDGRFDEIAPCCRCVHCHMDHDEDGKTYEHCRVNACTQRAYRSAMPEGYELPAKTGDKKVMVIGGGPAGMEAARIAAMRGYSVTLYEKKSVLGGLLPFASAIKGPHENLDALNAYLQRQLEITGVNVVKGQIVDASFVKDQKPDVVIVATGGVRDTLSVKGTDSTKVVTMDDYATADLGENITVVGSNEQAIDTTLYLLAQGKHVTIVTSDTLAKVDKGQSTWVQTFVMPMVYARGTRVWPEAKITKVGDGEITINGETGVDTIIACDSIIEAMDMLPDTSISEALSGMTVYSIGDCNKPWNIAEAITAGNLTARKI